MPTIIDSLLVKLGFSVEPAGLEGFAELTKKAQETMLELGKVALEAATGIGEMVHLTAESMGGVYDFAESMGLSAREVDALGRVAIEHHSSLEGMKSTIQSITVATGQAVMGFGRAKMVFEKYHLAAKNADGSTKTFDQILGDVADKMQGMSIPQRQTFGARLGIDQPLIKLLAEGREEFDKLREATMAANPFAEEDYRLAEKTELAFTKASSALKLLGKRISVALMPTVNKVLDRFIAWTKESGNVAKLTNAIEKVVRILGVLWNNLGKIGAVFGVLITYRMGNYFLKLGHEAAEAAKAMTSVAGAGSTLTGIITGGLAAAIFLVAEDLWTFYRGGRSVTGLLVERFPVAIEGVKLALVGLSAALIGITTGSGPLALLIVGIGGLTIAAKDLYDSWAQVSQWFLEMWEKWGTTIQILFPPLGLVIQTAKLLQAAWDPVITWLGNAWDWLGDKIKVYLKLMAMPITLASKLMGIDLGATLGLEESGTGKTRAGLAGFGEADFYQRMAAFNMGHGATSPELPGNMMTWGRGVGATTNQTTNIGQVTFQLPNVVGGREAAREAHKELTRLAHGGPRG